MMRLVLAWVLVNSLLIAPQWAYTGGGETVGWIALEAALLKALAKDPNERYQSAGELVEALAGPTTDTRSVSRTLPYPGSQQTTLADQRLPECVRRRTADEDAWAPH